MGNDLIAKRNDELVLLYVNHAIKNLSEASEQIKSLGVREKFEGFNLIKDAIFGDYNYCLNNSVVLNAQDIFTVQIWFRDIFKITRYIGNGSLDNDAFKELQNKISNVLKDKALHAVREKLLNAVNQKRSQQHE